MHQNRSGLTLSPTDLAAHLGCAHRTELDLRVARGELTFPARHDPFLDALVERGRLHERAFVDSLRGAGKSVVDLDGSRSRDATIEAMRGGADVIVQATLESERYSGRVDLLLRVDEDSDLGRWSYQPADTKLAVDTRSGAILQLCVYAELLTPLQGRMPDLLHVITPLARESYRTPEVSAYFRFVKGRLEEAIGESSGACYPEPVALCEVCPWWERCNQRRRADDHLGFVAGMLPLHRRELTRQGVATTTQLAGIAQIPPQRPHRGTPESYRRLHQQARLQVAARTTAIPPFELLAREPARGLAKLPEPSAGDLFLDFEGDPFVGTGGLEYLTGWCWRAENGAWRYASSWSLDPATEKQAFERFIDFVMEHWNLHRSLHIYHFGGYESGALKRLATRYATRQDELDRLLRGGRLVDLHALLRESVRAGIERYGLKEMEPITGFSRSAELSEAGHVRRRFELALEMGDAGALSPEIAAVIEAYNRDDCLSAARLREWLEEQRASLVSLGENIPRPDPVDEAPSEPVRERDARIDDLASRLLVGVPDDPSARNEEQTGRLLLAQMLGYFRREEKCGWWEQFRLEQLSLDELMDEREALANLRFIEELPSVTATGRASTTPIHLYAFPPQETAVRAKQSLRSVAVDGEPSAIGEVRDIDLAAGTVVLRKPAALRDLHPRAVVCAQVVQAKALEDSLLALGEAVAERGFECGAPFGAAVELLLRRRPRRRPGDDPLLQQPGESTLDAGRRLCTELSGGVLPIQGPPGTGKTYSGARMILSLAQRGQRVGITAVSHKVILNLLQGVGAAAREVGAAIDLVERGEGEEAGPIEFAKRNEDALARISPNCIVGGTAWLWASPAAESTLDVLFIDEAGQMSLAQALAVCRAARNVVLLGDPQQLEQPKRGAHPEGAEVAALTHVLGPGRDTIGPEQGLFLGDSYRLHPAICAFTSEMYYDGRLRAMPGRERQELVGPTQFAGAGLFLLECAHESNQAHSPEEVELVLRVVADLLTTGVQWRSHPGTTRELLPEDVLVVAPYNAQVAASADRLRPLGVKNVGTVDRFQGQEAPVVVYSCATSSPDDAPRGMSFLYDPHRFNVATSRAQGVVILVASPRLFEPECRTPQEMRMANGLCRYRELARIVDSSRLG